MQNNTIQAFIALVRAGLWEKEAQLSTLGKIDFSELMQITEDQAVVGLVTAGLEHVVDVKVPQEELLQFIGQSLQLEQRNNEMNAFVSKIIELLRKKDIYALLVKGQGIAQCYERPLWRTSGDIDLLLSSTNYEAAKKVLIPIATRVEEENIKCKHIGLTIDSWMVELHGTLRSNCLHRMDKVTDLVQDDVFYGGNVRSWYNGNTTVFLPSPDNDVFFVFTHILKHFFHGGIGIRQICDWCRLLWIFREKVDVQKLEKRLKRAGIISEWKAFSAFAVEYLGMPVCAMPLYVPCKKWSKKAERIKIYIIEKGNFGHNVATYEQNTTDVASRKLFSFKRYTRDALQQFFLFPGNSIRVWLWVLKVGVLTMFTKNGN